uniref:Uncharacterized protein n=1 Tax=Lotharella globosa TaxID=91324 RepID=A0A6V3TZI3_9EUKA|mmetsp:Transcript_25567/g.49774  ORF Transcript_25567/g.49774 Transcript_25567/m.49774 type:complete len:244 (-) Transcript_25567:120-851(-)
MLRQLLVFSTSGMKFYSKVFIGDEKKQLSGLITAMLDFCEKKTGLPMSYVEMAKIGVAIARDNNRRLICCLIIDKQDGREFGRLIAQMMLDEFSRMYPAARPSDDFSAFNTKISEVIWASIHPILDSLIDQHKGVQLALLTSGDSIKHATHQIDKLGLLANLQALLRVATNIMASQNDLPLSMEIKGLKNRVIISRIERTTFIVACRNSIDERDTNLKVEATAQLLKTVLVIGSNIQDVWKIR